MAKFSGAATLVVRLQGCQNLKRGFTMRKKLAFIALNYVLLLSVGVLFINTQALGDKIALESRRRDNHTEIYVVVANGENERNLTNTRGKDQEILNGS